MATLSIFLLGGVAIEVEGCGRLRFPTRKSKSLLAFLVLGSYRSYDRSTLAGQLWPDVDNDRAQRSLNTELWRLRSMLNSIDLEPATFLHSCSESVGFRRDSDHWVDAGEFHAMTDLSASHHPEFLSDLSRAVALYRGDLAEGVVDEWCLVQREKFRARLIAALDYLLARAMDAKHWQAAIGFGRRLLDLDPLQEHVYRALMHCQFNAGNRAGALKQYAACKKILHDELQIEPMDETRETYEAIASSQRQRLRVGPIDAHVAPHCQVQDLLDKIETALGQIAHAQAVLEDASTQLMKLSKAPR